jgi:hypothetical protein
MGLKKNQKILLTRQMCVVKTGPSLPVLHEKSDDKEA